jgi:hypothetical protein
MNLLLRAFVSGTFASVAAAVALAVCAKREGHSAPQPMNATSHWVHGDLAALVRDVNFEQTAVGYGTHHIAAILWAYLFELLRNRTPEAGLVAIAGDALTASASAALIDYTVTPHRLTPGWELILSKRSMALGYLSMAAGLVVAEYVLPRRNTRN